MYPLICESRQRGSCGHDPRWNIQETSRLIGNVFPSCQRRNCSTLATSDSVEECLGRKWFQTKKCYLVAFDTSQWIPYQRKACKIAALHFWRNFDHRCAEIFVFFLTNFFLVGTEEMLNVNMRFPDSLNNWSSLKWTNSMVSRLSWWPATINLSFSSYNSDFYKFCLNRLIRNVKMEKNWDGDATKSCKWWWNTGK